MKPWRRSWAIRLAQSLIALFAADAPRVIRVHPARIRKLQKRHAQLAFRHPLTPPKSRTPRGLEDRGFQ